jgi:hypothetical protein
LGWLKGRKSLPELDPEKGDIFEERGVVIAFERVCPVEHSPNLFDRPNLIGMKLGRESEIDMDETERGAQQENERQKNGGFES